MTNLHVVAVLLLAGGGRHVRHGDHTTVRPAGRLPVTFATPAVNGEITSNVAVDFGLAPSALSISHWAIFDALGRGQDGGALHTAGAASGSEGCAGSGSRSGRSRSRSTDSP